MTTAVRPPSISQQVHIPRRSVRKAVAGLVIALGAVTLGMTAANNLFNVGPSFENLMGDFRPHLTNSAIATDRSDLAGLAAAGTELQTKMVPALAQQLGMTPAEFSAFVAKSYPQVSTGLTALPQITTTFNGLVTTLDKQRPLFRSADAIPTKDVPATTMPWALAGVGVVLILLGGWMWVRPRAGAMVAVGLGALLVATPLVLTLPQKAADADQLNSNLKPVYTATLVAQSKAALTTVSAMGTQLQTEMLPALAGRLQMTPTQLQQFLGQNFPATAAALSNLPAAMPRFQSLVTAFDSNLDNYNTLKPVEFVPIIWTMIVVGLLVGLGGTAVLLRPPYKTLVVS
jgi:hypothetical protein